MGDPDRKRPLLWQIGAEQPAATGRGRPHLGVW
jgi:hypothetical protein